jgi:hypothetical protein
MSSIKAQKNIFKRATQHDTRGITADIAQLTAVAHMPKALPGTFTLGSYSLYYSWYF